MDYDTHQEALLLVKGNQPKQQHTSVGPLPHAYPLVPFVSKSEVAAKAKSTL